MLITVFPEWGSQRYSDETITNILIMRKIAFKATQENLSIHSSLSGFPVFITSFLKPPQFSKSISIQLLCKYVCKLTISDFIDSAGGSRLGLLGVRDILLRWNVRRLNCDYLEC